MKNKSKYNSNMHHRRSIRLKGYDYSQAGLYFITICCQDRICRFGHVENGEMILNEYGQIAYDEWMKLSNRFHNMELDVFQIMPNHMHGIIKLVGATLEVAQNDDTNQIDVTQIDVTQIDVTQIDVTQIDVTQNVTTQNDNTQIDITPMDTSKNDVTQMDPTQNDTPKNHVTQMDMDMDMDMDIRATARVAPTVSDIVGAYKSLVANRCLNIYKTKNKIMGKLWQRNFYEHIIRNEKSFQNISEYILNNPAKWLNDKIYTK
ncbi:MAG: putative transposase [Bacteroidia bacterium]|jgi:putative transposase